MSILLESGDLVYKVLTPDLKQQATDTIISGFMDEPISRFLVPDHDARFAMWERFCLLYTDFCSLNGLSVICVSKLTNQVAGCFWAKDFILPEPDNFENVADTMANQPLLKVLGSLDEAYKLIRVNIKSGECADLWMLGVHPDFRKLGIGKQMTILARDLAFTRGFQYVVLEATGSYSAQCAKCAGMQPMVTINYAEQQPQALGNGPKEHPNMVLWEVKREDWEGFSNADQI